MEAHRDTRVSSATDGTQETPVPRYFFNVHDGVDLQDEEGTELPDLDTARRIAIQYAGALLEESGPRLGFGQTWRLETTDEARTVLFQLDFRVSSAA